MPQVKISELPTGTSPTGAESLVVVQGGQTKQITAANLLTRAHRPDGSANYGWDDYLGVPDDDPSTGGSTPTWSAFSGNIYGRAFSPTAMKQRQFRFHILHNYASGTPLYLHAHWSPSSTNIGTVRWGFEYIVAKGHSQEAFSSPITVYKEQATTGANGTHFVAEVSDIDAVSSSLLEPDTLLIVRVFRDATHINDTYTGDAFLWNVDAHVRTSQNNTTNKAPPFN